MDVKNHFNETVKVNTIKHYILDVLGTKIHFIKAQLPNGELKYWDYKEFMKYNPDFVLCDKVLKL